MNRERIVSLLLSLLMIFSMIPYSAFAESEVTDEEAAPFEETVELSEDHPEVEIIVEDAEPDDLTAEAPEETAEEEQPTEESEDGLTEEENAEINDIAQDNSISDNPDPTKDESEWTDEKDETAELEQPADEGTDDDPQEEEQAEELPVDDPVEEQPEPLIEYADPWDEAINLFGHAYGRTKGETSVYEDADLKGNPVFIINQEDGILLATEYREQNGQKALLIWCLSEDDIITGYVPCNTLKDDIMTDDADIAELRLLYDAFPVRTNAGDLYAFHVEGYTPMQESEVAEEIPDVELPDPDEGIAPEEKVTDSELEEETEIQDEPVQEEAYSVTAGQVDDYIAVTTNTRAFMTMDESATDTYDGDYCLGYFVRDAVVQIAAIEQDEQGRAWYQVRYMFGDTYTDGSLKWTDYGFTWVLAQDTGETDADACTVTDYALTAPPIKKKGMLKAATPTYGFSLRTAYGTMGSFYVGQYPLYGSSGSDSAYKQIAKLSGHGAVYATPHYLEGVPVYCLEHTYPGPGENKSSGGKQPTGPYIIVDIDSYMYNPGYSRIIYNKSTLHAIAWVLRHTYPFMVLDRYDADNDTWSRCAGQFAIREVIKQLEGPQYVRDYWDLNSFYTGSDQAPAEYLEYAKWLAYNGIARASITGYITEANKFMFTADGKYYGSVTLSTDADMIRIPCSVGSLTGNSLGSDGSYYYLNSGDTVVVASSVNGFSLYAESINSDTEEASFMIGVPDAQIQKVLIPIYGAPYPMQGISLWFEEETQYGSLTVTKVRDRGSMEALAGAAFQLYDANGNTYGGPQTTGADGTVTWTQLPYGAYSVKETGAPTGYNVDLNQYQVTINGSNTLTVRDAPIIGSIQLVKKSKRTGIPLAGAEFELLTKSGNQYVRAVGADGNELPTVTTDAEGKAAWNNAVEYGEYFAHEIKAPEGYQLVEQYYAVGINQQAQVEIADAVDPIIQGKIRIVKTDADTGVALEGVEFTITQLSAPSSHGNNAEGLFSATLTTNKDGIAETGWLDWGRYQITETKGPAHYVDAHFSTTVDVTEHEKIYTVSVTNEQNKGYIHIVKTDAKNGTPLKGVVFDIYQGEKLISSMTTDQDGAATSEALTQGSYTVKEHTNPEGYIGTLFTQECAVKADETVELNVTNQPVQGKIKLLKQDALTKEPLADVKFTVTKLTASPAANGAGVGKVITLTTGSDGTAETDWLDYGKYTIQEVEVPAHYVDQPFSAKVMVTEDQKTYTVTAENEPTKGKIQITKTDKLDGQPIAGVVFDIYLGEKLIGTMTTNEKGIAISDLLPKGHYTVKEHENPEGYVADLVSLDCEVKSDETTKLTADNMPIQFHVKILKTDSLTKQPLAGVEFTITRVSGLPSHNGAGVGEAAATLTTDANGEAVSDLLTWGVYEVKETKFPAHYVQNPFSVTITGTENNKVYEINAENEPTKGKIQITKTDKLDGLPIAGVVFDIYQGEKKVGSMTTNEKGIAVSDPLSKGHYTVKEHENPEGYVANLVSLDCEVKSDETTKLVADNMPIQFRIKILKTDGLTKQPLTGAEFTIKRTSGLPSHGGDGDRDVVATLTTDANGEAISDLLTWGEYEIVESKVPLHYVDNHFSTSVSGTEDQKTYEVRVENEPTKGWVQIIKTDALDRTPIEGVQFDIYYADEYGSGLAATMITDKNGVAKSEALRKGRYVVKEHADPTGYVTDLVSLNCEIRSDEITQLTATNQPIQGRIRIVKTDELTKEPLAGAEFTITRVSGLPSHKGSNDGEVVAVITTDVEGIALSPLLTWGTYQVEETGVPLHYVDNHFCTEAVIDQENLKTYEVYCENEPTKGWIRLSKTDRKNGNPISGVQFDLYYNDQYGEGLACSMITDEDGIAMSEPIRKGQYIVKEHGETAGYVFEEVTLACTVHSDEITDLCATNQPVQVKLKLYKRDLDEYTGDPADVPMTRGDGVLTGAMFQVLAGADIQDRQGNIIHEKGDIVIASLKTAGEEAAVTTEELWPGLYEIVELSPPTGYQPSEEHFFVDASEAALQSKEAVITYEGVKQNEILYGKHAIIKFLGDNLVHDDAGIVETPETGAEFEVFLRSAGSYEAAREYERDYLITNASGYAVTKLLPYGIYTLRQTKGADGYAIKSPMDIMITGTEDLSSPPITIINNEAINYRIKITKIDAESGQPVALANTGFRLLDRDGVAVEQTVHYPTVQTIDTFYTDDSGEVTLPETVTYGLYFIQESKAPSGYLIPDGELPIFVGDSSMRDPGEVYLLEYTMANEPVMGRIVLEKTGPQLVGFEAHTDAWGNEYQQPIYADRPLADAVFEVYAAEDIIGHDGTAWFAKDELVDTIITTADGHNESRELPLGKYYLIETSAPEGYIFDDTRYEVHLEYLDDTTPLVEVTVTAKNDYLSAEISLRKEKEILEVVHDKDSIMQRIGIDAGEGFVFGLFCQDDIHYADATLMADTLMATGITDADGKLTFAGMFPHGRYYIKELSAAEGWKLNAESFCVIISPDAKGSDNVIHVAIQEPIRNELIYTLVTLTKTDVAGQQTVPGAQIEVRDSNGNVIYRAFTDENGEIPNIPVIPGTYFFKEILAPEGYALYETEMQFSVDRDGNITGSTTMKDDYTRFFLFKKDADGKPLAGVEFGLIKGAGEPLFTAVSDENGIVTFEKIPYGTYSVVETKPLPGYIPNETAVRVQIDGTYVNPDMPIANIVNEPNEVLVKKIGQDGKPLPGATFALCDAFGSRTATAISDQDGIVRFERIPYGEYTIREIIAPDGYLLSKDMIDLTVDADYRNTGEPIGTVVNKLKNLPFIKQNTAGEPMEGVSFSLLNATNGEVMETVTSNSKGEFFFGNFDYGLWVVHENKAPDGYALMPDYSVSVDGTWNEPAAVILTNIPDHYEFLKTDNEGNPMAGVKFRLEDAEGNALQELVSGEDGMVYVTGLVPGRYVIRETETLEGFTVSDDPIEIIIDDEYVIEDEIPVFVNYPVIQTGVDLEITPPMIAGAALIGAAGIGGVVMLLKRKKNHGKG